MQFVYREKVGFSIPKRITVVWKIFVRNYFVVRNIQKKNFCGFPVPTKIFLQRIKIVCSFIATVKLTINLSFLVGLITKQQQLKRLATDGCARYI